VSHPGSRPGRFGIPMVWISEVESTNDVARWMAAFGVPEGGVVVAERQMRGRGRWGRAWASPAGGLWCSVLLRPTGQPVWGRLSLAVGVAVAETIELVTGLRVGIYWPNDLIVDGRKTGGILIEGHAGAIVVGVGINTNVAMEELPADVAPRATSLHLVTGHAISHAPLLEALLRRLEHWYRIWADGDLHVVEAWSARDVTRAQRVIIGGPGEPVEGIAEGVDDDGALRLRVTAGDLRRIVAGDLLPLRERSGAP